GPHGLELPRSSATSVAAAVGGRLQCSQVVDELTGLANRHRVELHADDVAGFEVRVDAEPRGDRVDAPPLRFGRGAVVGSTDRSPPTFGTLSAIAAVGPAAGVAAGTRAVSVAGVVGLLRVGGHPGRLSVQGGVSLGVQTFNLH